MAALALSASATAQNPVVSTWCTPDPAPYVHGDTVYLFTGHDKDTANYFRMPDWQLYSTTDMVNWTYRGRPITTTTFGWAKQGDNAWASQAIERGGKWYWYVACEDTTNHLHGIGVAVADHADGPYRDALGHPLVPGNWGYIDPTVFVDDDGSAWLFWGNNGLWYAQLGDDMVSLKSKITPVDISDSTAFGPLVLKYDYALGKKVMKGNFEEAPWVYRRGNLYYLEYAAGGVPEHWAYSTAHSIHGPWTYRSKVMGEPEKSFTIHGGAITVGGRSFMFYHNGRLPWGSGFRRSTAVEEFRYGGDGSIPFIPFTNDGVRQPLRNLNPFARVEAETMADSRGVKTDSLPTPGAGDGNRSVLSGYPMQHYVTQVKPGAWIRVRCADLASGASAVAMSVRNGKGNIELHADSIDGQLIASVPVSKVGRKWKTVKAACNGGITGVHDVYLVFPAGGCDVDWWQLYK